MNNLQFAEAQKRLVQCLDWVVEHYGLEVVPRENAPQTFKDLVKTMREENNPNAEKVRVIVWNGASETALFGSAGNYIFRAWHDYTHWLLNVDFKTEHEYQVMLSQIADYEMFRCSEMDKPWDMVDVYAVELLRLEIYGQRVVYDATKEYLDDQKTFAKEAVQQQEALYTALHNSQK